MTFKIKKMRALDHHAEFVEVAQKSYYSTSLANCSMLIVYVELNLNTLFDLYSKPKG